MVNRLSRLVYCAMVVAAVTPKAVWGESRNPKSKLDESLQSLLDQRCRGTHSVIVQTEDGFRERLAASLKAHGNKVRGEFASINGVAADVSCSDLRDLAGFESVHSISTNFPVEAHSASKVEGTAAAALQAPLLQTLLGSTVADKVDIGVAVIDSGILAGPD